MRALSRGFPGMPEVPVLKELNDIREKTGHDLSVLPENEFNDIANLLTFGKYGPKDIEDAYLQLHLIADNGGSHAPQFVMEDPNIKVNNKNKGKYNLKRSPVYDDQHDRDDMRSREALAVAMLRDEKLSPVITNAQFLEDTGRALDRFVTSTSLGSPILGNSGVRTKYAQDDPMLRVANIQMWNDLSGGRDRLSGDYIGNQKIEFGHVYPADLGGSDSPDNGRAQAKHANHATGKRLGVPGAMSALGPKHKKLNQRFAGDSLLHLMYTQDV